DDYDFGEDVLFGGAARGTILAAAGGGIVVLGRGGAFLRIGICGPAARAAASVGFGSSGAGADVRRVPEHAEGPGWPHGSRHLPSDNLCDGAGPAGAGRSNSVDADCAVEGRL